MAEPFLALPKNDRLVLLRQQAEELGILPFVLEKDVWICWALEQLFNMPDRLAMAFKGGTSLSKVYKVIDRFSEDIDVTLDYREFTDATTGSESRVQLTKLSDKLKVHVLEHTRDKVKPYFEEVLSKQFGDSGWKVKLHEDGERLFVHFPSALDETPGSGYLSSSVLLEFGGRNITEPNDRHVVSPYLSGRITGVAFPEPTVTVLALARTFWEKVTLIHVECNRPEPRAAERMSRHWYDVHQISRDLSGLQSDYSQKLLGEVVSHKKLFFHYGYANYDSCLSGGLRIAPPEKLRNALDKDFESMVKAGMFYSNPPSFEDIVDRLKEVEQQLNESIRSHKI